MDPLLSRRIGNIVLAISIAILLWELCEMLGYVPRLVAPQQLNLIAIVLLLVAGALRRRGRGQKPSESA